MKPALMGAPLMAVGMIRLVQAIQTQMLAARTVEGICQLFLKLFLPLFDARGIRIAFTPGIRRHFIEAASPEGFRAGDVLGLKKLKVRLCHEGTNFGSLELYFEEGHPTFDAPSHALLDFTSAFLAERIATRLSAESRFASLTKAERKVLLLLEQPTSEILDELGISEATLRTHLKNLYRKLGVSSRRDALHVLSAQQESQARLQA